MASAKSDKFNYGPTNSASKFKDFSIKLSNGATLTGLVFIPPTRGPYNGSSATPLLIGIHGTTCSAHTYDLSPGYTASTHSETLGVPYIAFNRPNFLQSSGWLVDRSSSTPTHPQWHADEGKTYFQEEGRWFHEFIFPALWETFGVTNGCTSIVTQSHSMSVPGTLEAANLYCSEPPSQRTYTWAGMILSGYGEHPTEHCRAVSAALQSDPEREAYDIPPGLDETIHVAPFRHEDRADLMLGPGPDVCAEGHLRPLIIQQTTPMHIAEIIDMVGAWPARKTAVKAGVKIPVLYALAEYDWPWQGTKENVDAFCADFANAPRVEGACVKGACHAIELSKVARGWWLRVFGWAMEVAMSEALDKPGKPGAFV